MNTFSRKRKYWVPVIVLALIFAVWRMATAGDSDEVFLYLLVVFGIILGSFGYLVWKLFAGWNSLSFSLKKGGNKRLTVKWQGNFKHISVTIDGVLVGTLEKIDNLKKGNTILLPDGSELLIKPGQHPVKYWSLHLELQINGVPIPGSLGDPEFELDSAALLFFITGFVSLFLGFLVLIDDLLVGLFALIIIDGIAILICGVLIRRRSKAGLWLAIILLSIDILVLVVLLASSSGVEMLEIFSDLIEVFFLGIGIKHAYTGFNKLKDIPSDILDRSYSVR